MGGRMASASDPGSGAVPADAGVGLRAPHVAEVLATRPPIAWVEVHPENYLGGGPPARQLTAVRARYPVALHAVGLSLGTAEGIDGAHLERLAALVERIEPGLVSEHLSWSTAGGAYLNHLLPLPYTEEALAVVARNVDRVQARLRRRLLVENPSVYLRLRHSPIPEAEFLGELVRRTGCGLLCDVNNVHVTCANLGHDPGAYLDRLPAGAVGEIHLAGHSVSDADGVRLFIDDHGSPVADPVWALYDRAIARFGPVPTLVEWDTDLPPLAVLLREAERAQARLALPPVGGTGRADAA
jgi:uncharacterized protein (UPF0276 family)